MKKAKMKSSKHEMHEAKESPQQELKEHSAKHQKFLAESGYKKEEKKPLKKKGK